MTTNTTAVDVSRTLHQPTEWKHLSFCVEASDLRLPPDWCLAPPKQLTTDLGNGQPFLLKLRAPDFSSVVYVQANGCIQLTVFND
jgi:hypothetical protein